MADSTAQSSVLQFIYRLVTTKKLSKAKKRKLSLDKRQKFAIGVALLSAGLFFSEFLFNTYGIIISFFMALVTNGMLFWAIRGDLQDNFSFQVFILPFLYSLSFGLFAFLTPERILTRLILTIFYAVGLYSVFLSENIFTVASIRTIALLNSARIVSLVISLITFFFLASTTFSLRIDLIPTILLLLLFILPLSIHALWTYTLERSIKKEFSWVGVITVVLSELGIMLWFWPTSPTIVALFLTSIWYVCVGLSHVWLDKRLFKNVLWEYLWVAIISFFMLISFTRWQ